MDKTLIITLGLALFLSACGDSREPQKQSKEQGQATTEAAGHGAAGEKITHFTDRTELFVEFPRLIVGEKAAFAAHLTRVTISKPCRKAS